MPSVAPYLPPDTVRPRGRWRGGIGEAGLSVWRATRDIDAGEELVLDYGVFSLFTEGGGGAGGWFAALFPALLDGEVYPDHRQWSTSAVAGSAPGSAGLRPLGWAQLGRAVSETQCALRLRCFLMLWRRLCGGGGQHLIVNTSPMRRIAGRSSPLHLIPLTIRLLPLT